MCYIWWMEMKNTIKDEGVLIFCVLVPLGYPLIYSWIYNNEVVRDVPVAVVDMSHSEASREFARRFDASPSTKVAYYCDNLNDAKTLIGQQKAYGILYFPESFQRDLGRSEQAHVGVYCEMSFMLTYKAIFQTATSVAADMNTAIQLPQSGGFTNRDDEINAKPLDFDEIAMFNSPLGYGNALLPAVLILILQQTLLLGIGLSAGQVDVLLYDLLCDGRLHHAGRAANVPLHGYRAARSPGFVHDTLHLGCHLLRHVPLMYGTLSRECYIAGGLHVGSLPLYEWRELAAKQHTGHLGGLCQPHTLHLWRSGLPQAELHGCRLARRRNRVSGAVDTGAGLLLCHLHGISLSDSLSQKARHRTHGAHQEQPDKPA